MKVFESSNGILTWTKEGERLRIQGWGKNSIRVTATREPAFGEQPWALQPNAGKPAAMTIAGEAVGSRAAAAKREGGDSPAEATVTNGRTVARVDAEGRLSFFRAAGGAAGSDPFLEEIRAPRARRPFTARMYRSLSSHLYEASVHFKARDGERFYGLGQHQHGLFDQKGCIIELAQDNTEVAIPFLVSSLGYGFLWNNPAIGRVELLANGTNWRADATREIDYLVTAGDSPSEIMEEYGLLTGYAPMMPEYAAGFWQSKLRYENQEELLSIAREYAKRKLPLSVIVIDFFHWTRMGEWKFDPAAWPNPRAMVDELAKLGVEVMVSVWPSVSVNSENFAEMRARDLLVKSERGAGVLLDITDTDVPGLSYVHYYDPTNPEARSFIWEKVKASYHDLGIKIFWLDACEPEIRPHHPENLRYHLGNGAEAGCIYPMLHERGFYEGMTAAGQKEVLNLCRSAWAGSQRWGAAVWSGDIDSTFAALKVQVTSGLNMAMSGIPWWTTDIGGFYGGDTEDPTFRELIVRWFQYAVFCPLFRLHGFRNSWNIKQGGPNEVWSYGEEAYAILTEQLLLRERLKPYVLAQMRLAHEKGIPPMRPLFFDYPEDAASWEIDDEFLFGPDILVAPIVEQGERSRRVYLPAGVEWRNAWTDESAKGGEWLEAQAPLEHIPVFLKGGAKLPMRAGS